MKKKLLQNTSGIKICDSIVMSVKKKRVNLRKPEAVLIAVIGFVSVIAAFLGMFEFNYNKPAVVLAAVVLSTVYIAFSLMDQKGSWGMILSVTAGTFVCFRMIDSMALGYKFVYNVIYHAAYKTEIEYYKFLDPALEKSCTTAFFIFYIWILAMAIYFFTIRIPNPILPLIVSFPPIEIGLYNGIELPVFWGVLVVAYWIAVFAMSLIDVGEYSGGSGGFVRKDDLFFPKRQMRLKVTEKCGVFIMLVIVSTGLITSAVLDLTGYKRSDEINRKRINIRDAVNSFSMQNVAESISNITEAFGFTFKYESHKLGNVDHLRYKNTTDLMITVDQQYDSAIYLKEYTGSVYENNEWFTLDNAMYKSQVFDDFDDYAVYPQDLPGIFNEYLNRSNSYFNISINSQLKGDHSFAPYGTLSLSGLSYNHDSEVSSKKGSEHEFAYRFRPADAEAVAEMLHQPVRSVLYTGSIVGEDWESAVKEYCTDHGLLSYDSYFAVDSALSSDVKYMYENPHILMAELIQSEYRDFVFDNYLQVPDNSDMLAIRSEYADLISAVQSAESAEAKLKALSDIRSRIASTVTYSLDPGKTPSNRDFVHYFLTENKKGYCTHYATAGVILARMSGIPARYATGYVIVGDDFSSQNMNPDGSYTIQVKDNRSHAWTEIYLDGYGWLPFEFTAGYTNKTIDTTPTTSAVTSTSTQTTTTATRATASAQSSTRRSRSSNGSGRVTTTATTAVTTIAVTGTAPGGNVPARTLPAAVRYIACSVLGAVIVIALVLLRRTIILWLRNKHFTKGAPDERIGYIYSYAEALLAERDIRKKDMQYAEFAELVEKRLGGRLFTAGDFRQLIRVALDTVFSNSPADNKQLKQCILTVNELAGNIYKYSGTLQKLILKYLKVLI